MTDLQDANNDEFKIVDFHRNTFVLIPLSGEDSFQTILLEATPDKKQKQRVFCSCTKGGYASCIHGTQLVSIYNKYIESLGGGSPYEHFIKSQQWSIIETITRVKPTSMESVKKITEDPEHRTVTFADNQNAELIICNLPDEERLRLVQRLSKECVPSRYELMNKGLDFIRSDQEKALLALGHKTQRQTVEDCLWYRLAYHVYRESKSGFAAEFEVDGPSGSFWLLLTYESTRLRINVPPKAVPGVLDALVKTFPDLQKFLIRTEHELFFKVRNRENDSVSIIPSIKIKTSEEKVDLFSIRSRFVYDTLVYISDLNVFVRMNLSSLKLLATGWDMTKSMSKGELSTFLEQNETAFSIGSSEVTTGAALDLFSSTDADDYCRIAEPQVITRFERVELCPITFDNDICTISVKYISGKHSISLSDLLTTRKNKQRFFFSGEYIVDCKSAEVHSAIVSSKGIEENGTLVLSRAALLQFRGSALSTHFSGEEKLVKRIRQMLEFKPIGTLPELNAYSGILRDYQTKGVQWLLFLYDNNFGGLLCDDMGLGKTHQILAFLVSVKEHRAGRGPVLIVCPTTVLTHWNKVLAQFAPSLKRVTYHLSERESLLTKEYDILLTSYGILRNDCETLEKTTFDIAVFDEAQQMKNVETALYSAAMRVRSNIKICLTGTPVENSLSDLKALFDLTLPGLLSTDLSDEEVLFYAMNAGAENRSAKHLQRLTGPFILRRLKQTVLDELPPKIIDKRTCALSSDQYSMYQTALEKRGEPLLAALRDSDEPVQYMHIFSFLNFLKQVCNHPALAAENPQAYESYESGKWDLFKELLDESIGSGQKVVVFSQYLGMIEIMRLYLEKMSIGHVVLTGASRKRDQILNQFANDENCRVFVSSLKAGGVGIDLVAGSVVIHYDRWWNAAREDQATDRVHRIGQQRGVQVFKMITEGTVEESIDSMIEKKKLLADAVLAEDSPDNLKQFTREELIELLSNKRIGE